MHTRRKLYGECLSVSSPLLDSSVGSGKFHVYCLDNMFAIESYDLRFNKDTLIETPEPEFMSLQYYSSVSGEELHPYRQLSPNSLRAYKGQNRTKYRRCSIRISLSVQ